MPRPVRPHVPKDVRLAHMERMLRTYREALTEIADQRGCQDPGCMCSGGEETLCDKGVALAALPPGVAR